MIDSISADRSEPGAEGCSFPRAARLLNPSAYAGVFGDRKNIRLSDRNWTVLAVRNSLHPPIARLGLAISKKRARRAVDRNRLKRLIRESFRQHRADLSGYDIVVMNRDRSLETGNGELKGALEQHWTRLSGKANDRRQGKATGRGENPGNRRGGRS